MDDTKLLPLAEVREIFGISKTTLHNWIKAGKLHPVRVSKKSVYIERKEIDELIQKSKR